MKHSFLLFTACLGGVFVIVLTVTPSLPRASAAPHAVPAAAPQDDFDDVMAKAKLNYNRRNYEEALKFYKRANKMKGENCAECLWGMAQTYNKLGANKNVIETCDRLVPAAADDKPLVAKAHNLKGITLAGMAMEKMEKPDMKKLADAEAAFRSAMGAAPDTSIVRFNLGITLIRLNREAEGLKELKAYVQDADEDSESADEARKTIANPRRARENYAPDFTVTTAEGEYIDSEELRGKVILMDFWGTWCPPCRESVPALASLAKKFSKEPFVLLSVDVGDEPGEWRSFIAKNKMSWPQYHDRSGKVERKFQVQSFPTYVLVDHEGIVRYRTSGYSDYVEGMIADAIKKSLKTAAKAGPPKTQAAPVSTATSASAPSAAPKPAPASTPAPATPVPQPSRPAADDDKSPREMPVPVLEITGSEPIDAGGMKVLMFSLSLKNWADYPAMLFTSSPDLPPCSLNDSATRIQVIVWSEDKRPLATYCNLPFRQLLQRLNVMSYGNRDSEPMKVYVTIEDRRSHSVVKSNVVPLVPPAGKKP